MDRFNGGAPVAKEYTIGELELHTWLQRDRACESFALLLLMKLYLRSGMNPSRNWWKMDF
jgi:hypothetical protein